MAAFSQAPPIGSWRVHHSYAGTLEVVQGDKIYTATSRVLNSATRNC